MGLIACCPGFHAFAPANSSHFSRPDSNDTPSMKPPTTLPARIKFFFL